MITEIYAIRDKAVDAFLQPFFSPSVGSATRSLMAVVNDPNHDFAKNVNDFTLFRLGTIDDSTGLITPEPEPILITALYRLKTTV